MRTTLSYFFLELLFKCSFGIINRKSRTGLYKRASQSWK
ncbi:hypothetical protein M8C21_008250 [Ambrosia artemisiifolia]|uniref:Uncharacterized protein n=1 Tax=Ambrosia artemisiifolia TaxID=4212 RepID=A0AAD5GL52_AMBAR|nr:hypothetical protein M8C21_008250 [Ambrosia artemisiifolia]